jgi:hypothetical protein
MRVPGSSLGVRTAFASRAYCEQKAGVSFEEFVNMRTPAGRQPFRMKLRFRNWRIGSRRENIGPRDWSNCRPAAHSYGETYKGVNAAAAVPEVTYSGPGTPVFETQYQIPRASSYDWSSFPVQFANSTFATWTQPISGGQLAGRDAVGLDYANQSRDGYYTFLAGAILGLAGGAVLSAFQEALDANERK